MGILFMEFCCKKEEQGFYKWNRSDLSQMRKACLQKSTNTKLLLLYRSWMTSLKSENSRSSKKSDTVNVAL